MSKKPLEIDMAAGSQLRDTQGEMLSVEGADISELIAGRGRLNDNHGKGFFNSIGSVTGAKKIFKEEDCENDRHRYYWEKIKAPYIYVKGYLYDDEDHPNAKAAAAIMRNIHKTDMPLKMKASVEGGVISRGIKDPDLLARTRIHSVALTFTPANNATLVEPTSLSKSANTWETDRALIKSVMHLAKTNIPSFRHVTRHAQADKIINNIYKINELAKANGLTPISGKTANEMVEQAINNKIENNIKKINELVKKTLNKAVPKPEVHAYNLGIDNPEGGKFEGYTGKDAKKAQLHALKTAMNNDVAEGNHIKMMEHLETGKREPHILVHHGINHNTGDATGTASKRPKDAGNHNVFSVKDGTVDHPSFGVHTLYHSVADEYTNNVGDNHEFKDAGVKGHMRQFKDGDDWGYEETSDSGVHSFWVPVSGIHSMRQYENSRFKNEKFPLPSGYFDTKYHDDEADARDSLSDDPHADEQKHIVIRPGKYRQASHDDLKEIHKKSQNDDASISPFEGYKRSFTKDGVIEGGKLIKALTAGYGGGAPTQATGGLVLQSESLESDTGSFKYFTCSQCGKEQIHAANQVKCRSCNKGISLDQLYGLLINAGDTKE